MHWKKRLFINSFLQCVIRMIFHYLNIIIMAPDPHDTYRVKLTIYARPNPFCHPVLLELSSSWRDVLFCLEMSWNRSGFEFKWKKPSKKHTMLIFLLFFTLSISIVHYAIYFYFHLPTKIVYLVLQWYDTDAYRFFFPSLSVNCSPDKDNLDVCSDFNFFSEKFHAVLDSSSLPKCLRKWDSVSWK